MIRIPIDQLFFPSGVRTAVSPCAQPVDSTSGGRQFPVPTAYVARPASPLTQSQAVSHPNGRRVLHRQNATLRLTTTCRGSLTNLDDDEIAVLFNLHKSQGANLEGVLAPAIEQNSICHVRLLLGSGVVPSEHAMRAVANTGNLDIARLLLSAGGRPTFEAIHAALLSSSNGSHIPLVQLFLATGSVHLNHRQKAQLLSHVAENDGGLEWHRLLIDGFGAHVDTECCGGTTPLIEACRFKNDELAMYLLERGADIELHAPGKWTARTYAHRNQHQIPGTWARIARHELMKATGRGRATAVSRSAPERRAM